MLATSSNHIPPSCWFNFCFTILQSIDSYSFTLQFSSGSREALWEYLSTFNIEGQLRKQLYGCDRITASQLFRGMFFHLLCYMRLFLCALLVTLVLFGWINMLFHDVCISSKKSNNLWITKTYYLRSKLPSFRCFYFTFWFFKIDEFLYLFENNVLFCIIYFH